MPKQGISTWVRLAGALALALLVLPFASLLFTTPWLQLQLQQGDLQSIYVSVGYTLVALVIVLAGGTPLAWWLARSRFRGKIVLDALILLPLLAPPLVMGLMLALLFGPYAWAGQPLRHIGLELTNSPQAFVLAQVYAAAPYYVLTARSAFEGVPRELERMAATLGRGPWQSFWRISVPLSGLGLASGLALAWVRAMGEFGVVLIIAYFPQGIPVRLWVDLQDGGLQAVYPLMWLFFVVALPLPLAAGLVSRRHTQAVF
ncbi:MAG: ABC transporter permease subunit [Sinobacteraceae bacterium]|nr:ABC transporter permease subunit [Nevskiaceae bacterium]